MKILKIGLILFFPLALFAVDRHAFVYEDNLEDKASHYKLSETGPFKLLELRLLPAFIFDEAFTIEDYDWQALYKKKDGYELMLVNPEVGQPRCPNKPACKIEELQVEVYLKHPPLTTKPLFLVAGFKGQEKRKVVTLYDSQIMSPVGSVKRFEFHKVTYVLEKQILNERLQVTLSTKNKTQMLMDLDCHSSCTAGDLKLKWAGDIDDDEKPDFYIDLSRDGVGLQNFMLLLSSRAGKNELVQKVSETTLFSD
jgi:hypothetical protein